MSIKAKSFFKITLGTIFLPLKSTDKLRNKMHLKLSSLSTDYTQIKADQSSHFVWIDQPHLIVNAVEILINKIN